MDADIKYELGPGNRKTQSEKDDRKLEKERKRKGGVIFHESTAVIVSVRLSGKQVMSSTGTC